MAGLFDGTRFERPVTCAVCQKPLAECGCPRDAAGKVLLPSQQSAVVRLEKRPGGKVVTVVEGLDPQASDLAGLLKQIKGRCAAGGTVDAGAIHIQGDHRQVVAQMLGNEGYRVKMVR